MLWGFHGAVAAPSPGLALLLTWGSDPAVGGGERDRVTDIHSGDGRRWNFVLGMVCSSPEPGIVLFTVALGCPEPQQLPQEVILIFHVLIPGFVWLCYKLHQGVDLLKT